MASISFGIGGYGEKERKYLATVNSSQDNVKRLGEALRNVGFWTVLRVSDSKETFIEIGEVIRQSEPRI